MSNKPKVNLIKDIVVLVVVVVLAIGSLVANIYYSSQYWSGYLECSNMGTVILKDCDANCEIRGVVIEEPFTGDATITLDDRETRISRSEIAQIDYDYAR